MRRYISDLIIIISGMKIIFKIIHFLNLVFLAYSAIMHKVVVHSLVAIIKLNATLCYSCNIRFNNSIIKTVR